MIGENITVKKMFSIKNFSMLLILLFVFSVFSSSIAIGGSDGYKDHQSGLFGLDFDDVDVDDCLDGLDDCLNGLDLDTIVCNVFGDDDIEYELIDEINLNDLPENPEYSDFDDDDFINSLDVIVEGEFDEFSDNTEYSDDDSNDPDGSDESDDSSDDPEDTEIEHTDKEEIQTMILKPKEEENHIVYKVEIKPTEIANSIKFTETPLEGRPEQIKSQPNNKDEVAIQYLDLKIEIDDEYIKEEDVSQLSFYFKIKKDILKEKQVEDDSLILIRYHDDDWQRLETEQINKEDDEYVYYKADSEGCSTFAVVGDKIIENNEKDEESNSQMVIPWIFIIGFILTGIAVLCIVLYKAKYIYIPK